MSLKSNNIEKPQEKNIINPVEETGANKEVCTTQLEQKEENILKKNKKTAKRKKNYPTYDKMRNKHERKKESIIDPTKPLPTIKHELMARKIVSGQKKEDVYKEVYNIKEDSGIGYGSRIVNNPNVKARIQALLEQNPATSTQGIHNKITQLMDAQRAITLKDSITYVNDNQTQLETTKLVLKLQGALNDDIIISQKKEDINPIDASLLEEICTKLDNVTRQLNLSPIDGVIDISST